VPPDDAEGMNADQTLISRNGVVDHRGCSFGDTDQGSGSSCDALNAMVETAMCLL
jgi:hypothetical protein